MCGSNYGPREPMSEDQAKTFCGAKRKLPLTTLVELALVPGASTAMTHEAYTVLEKVGIKKPKSHKMRLYASAIAMDAMKFAGMGYAIYSLATQ